MLKILMGIILTLFVSGCAGSSPKIEEITKKIVKVETSNGKYTTVNKSSGAYGKYQIMPKTAKHYSKKLKINHKEWKKPENQDRIYQAILKDNIASLKKNGFDINAFTVYGCHQQGANGFKCIMKSKKLSKKTYMRLRKNLPKKYRYVKRSKLRSVWKNYWKRRLSSL